MGRAVGLSGRDLAAISTFETSTAFSDLDILALSLADAMTDTPAEIPEDLRRSLVERIGRGAFAELAASIAWENHRARLNRALDVQAVGFSDGAACALPAHRARTATNRPATGEHAS